MPTRGCVGKVSSQRPLAPSKCSGGGWAVCLRALRRATHTSAKERTEASNWEQCAEENGAFEARKMLQPPAKWAPTVFRVKLQRAATLAAAATEAQANGSNECTTSTTVAQSHTYTAACAQAREWPILAHNFALPQHLVEFARFCPLL